jgi:hypothetical protein
MAGETDLGRLLAGMRATLAPQTFVFSTLADTDGFASAIGHRPVMMFREAEGLTIILEEDAARRAGLPGTFRCRQITLEVHSSLEAVGFLAAVAARLSTAGIAVNPVAGFHHDHLFVPADRAVEALELLEDLARGAR